MGFVKWRAIALILALLCVPAVSAQFYDWTGTWDTSYGQMVLQQSGHKVVGGYSYDEGRIQGTTNRGRLVGVWSEAPSYKPPDGAGDVVLNMSKDGRTFAGKWRYGTSGGWSSWTGTRVSNSITSGNSNSWSDVHEGDHFLGVVEMGKFRLLKPYSPLGSPRLTNIPMQAAQPPESAELDLTEYEGRSIMVSGHDSGGWIYSARVTDEAGPILTSVVLEVFDRGDEKDIGFDLYLPS